MARRSAGPTVRAVICKGRVELLDPMPFEEGSLLDVTLVKTGAEVRIEQAEADRTTPSAEPIFFSIKGKPKSADPLEIFADTPNSPVVTVRFRDFATTCPLETYYIIDLLAKHIIAISEPPKPIDKILKKAIRGRSNREIMPGTKAANQIRGELQIATDTLPVDCEAKFSLWAIAGGLAISPARAIANAVTEIPEFAAESDFDVWERTQKKSPRGRAAEQQLATFRAARKQDLRAVFWMLTRATVDRTRRSLSGSGSAVTAKKAELQALAARLKSAAEAVRGKN
ncbi:MAG: hypothetical protein AAGJ97_09575 [Planctomycetota bacterium]